MLRIKQFIIMITLILFLVNPVYAFLLFTGDASETVAGKVELATDAETVTGTATDKVTTPANITAKMSAPGAIGDTTPSTGIFTTLQGKYQDGDDKTDTYNITSADFGKSLRMNSANDKIFNAPSVGASEDGARITLEKLSAGKVTFDCADTDTVADSGAGDTIYNSVATETYASLTLEYVHAVTKWFIISGHGTWTVTD